MVFVISGIYVSRRVLPLFCIVHLTHSYDMFVSALFAAVEHGYIDKARNILESTDVDVNRSVVTMCSV